MRCALNRMISPVLVRAAVVISSPLLSNDPQSGVAEFDGDGLVGRNGCSPPGFLPGDLDAAAARHLPLDSQPRSEPRDGEGDIQGLMRTGGVVLLPPRIDGGRGVGDGLEWRVHGQKLVLQGLVQPLDLASLGRRARRRGRKGLPGRWRPLAARRVMALAILGLLSMFSPRAACL